jgi:hypothetical protein
MGPVHWTNIHVMTAGTLETRRFVCLFGLFAYQVCFGYLVSKMHALTPNPRYRVSISKSRISASRQYEVYLEDVPPSSVHYHRPFAIERAS